MRRPPSTAAAAAAADMVADTAVLAKCYIHLLAGLVWMERPVIVIKFFRPPFDCCDNIAR